MLCMSISIHFCLAQSNRKEETLAAKSVIPSNNQIIVKFDPKLINRTVVNNLEKQEGTVLEFIDPKYIELAQSSEFFNGKLANLNMRKIFHSLKTTDTISISRLGSKVRIPEFWSAFVVTWEDDANQLNTLEAIEKLNTLQPFIEYAHLNISFSFDNLPNDSDFIGGEQAGLTATPTYPDAHINMDVAWDFSTGDYITKVGLIDSGIQWYHADLLDGIKVTPGFSRVKGGYSYTYGNKKNIYSKSADEAGHGTKMAGIIGAIRNNNSNIASIAGGNSNPNPNPPFFFQDGVSLYNLQCSEKGNPNQLALDYAADAIVEGASSSNTKTSNGFGFGLNIINMSFGGAFTEKKISDYKLMEVAIYFAFLNQVTMPASAGNNSSSELHIPSCFNDEWVMRVGASDEFGKKSSVSNIGNAIDFIAPGVEKIVKSLDYKNTIGTVTSDGTSSAAAHVSGVAALMHSYMTNQPFRPNDLAPEDIENLLQKFAGNGKSGNGYSNQIGWGKINAGNTLSGIKFPRFQVKHHSSIFQKSDAILSKPHTGIVFCSPILKCGATFYTGEEYEILFKIDIKQPSGRKILDVWPLNSESDVFDGYNKNPFKNQLTLVSWNKDVAIVKGLVYHLGSETFANNSTNLIDKWAFPNQILATFPDNELKVSVTVYSEDESITNTLSTSIDEAHVRILPNPSTGEFNLLFGLLKNTNLGVQVTDLSGKIVYSKPRREEQEGHHEIYLDLNHLNNGMYLCNIITTEGIITKKITVIH